MCGYACILQAFFRRAEAIKLALKNGEKILGCTAINAINDYKRSYELEQDLRTLQEAILVASKNGMHHYYVLYSVSDSAFHSKPKVLGASKA